MAELFGLLKLSPQLASLPLLLEGKEDKSRVGNVDFNDFVALKLFSLTHYVFDSYIIIFNFRVNDVSELDFSIYNYVKFTHD